MSQGSLLCISAIDAVLILRYIDIKENDLIKEIVNIVTDEKITTIVIGYPIGLMNNKSRMSDLVDKFIDKTLTKYFDLPIVKIDERLTSKILNKDSKFYGFFYNIAKKKGINITSFSNKKRADIFLLSANIYVFIKFGTRNVY